MQRPDILSGAALVLAGAALAQFGHRIRARHRASTRSPDRSRTGASPLWALPAFAMVTAGVDQGRRAD